MDAKAVGQRIKTAREKKNMTQEDLAALVDISPTHVSVIERGSKIPRLDTFVAIANVLEVSADSLLVDVVDHATKSDEKNTAGRRHILRPAVRKPPDLEKSVPEMKKSTVFQEFSSYS